MTREKRYYVSRTYDLSLLLRPSYALPMLEFIDPNTVVKRHGVCRDLLIKRHRDFYEASHREEDCLEYARYLLGLWIDPEKYIHNVSGDMRSIIDMLWRDWPYYGISVSPLDDIVVFATIFLSQNTDYHVNTVRWVKTMLEKFRDIREVAYIEPSVLRDTIGTSYQILMLPEALRCYLQRRQDVIESGRPQRILECPGVGPKIYFAYRLHVLLEPDYIPIDKNLSRFLRETLGKRSFRLPEKRYCIRYTCDQCPLRETCIENFLRERLDGLGGWLQTVVYTVASSRREHKDLWGRVVRDPGLIQQGDRQHRRHIL